MVLPWFSLCANSFATLAILAVAELFTSATAWENTKTTIKKDNKFINKNKIVFPGYIFIGFNLQNFNWTKINNTYGVAKVLVFNNQPSEISNDLIIALKIRYELNFNQIQKESLKQGDTIKFNNGPFVDLFARIENIDSTNRIWVLLEVMGGYRKLKLQQTKK